MKRKSHWMLGRELTEHWMSSTPAWLGYAFLVGCVEPDFNYFTYLKGSQSAERLRGHNFKNATAYMQQVCEDLSQREHWSLRSYYRFGKLMHYICDAFTHAHNENFDGNLKDHIRYEMQLQQHFLERLSEKKTCLGTYPLDSMMGVIEAAHAQYMQEPTGVHTDIDYVLSVSGTVAALGVPFYISSRRRRKLKKQAEGVHA